MFLGNMVLIVRDLYGVNLKHKAIDQVEMTIAKYLPVCAAWTIVVVFEFLLIFGFK